MGENTEGMSLHPGTEFRGGWSVMGKITLPARRQRSQGQTPR